MNVDEKNYFNIVISFFYTKLRHSPMHPTKINGENQKYQTFDIFKTVFLGFIFFQMRGKLSWYSLNPLQVGKPRNLEFRYLRFEDLIVIFQLGIYLERWMLFSVCTLYRLYQGQTRYAHCTDCTKDRQGIYAIQIVPRTNKVCPLYRLYQ